MSAKVAPASEAEMATSTSAYTTTVHKLTSSPTQGSTMRSFLPGTMASGAAVVEDKGSTWWTLDNVKASNLQYHEQANDEDGTQKIKLHWSQISPTAPFRVGWDVTVLVLLVYYVFAVPFRLCFVDSQRPDRTICQTDWSMQSESNCLQWSGCQWKEDLGICDQMDQILGLFVFDTIVDCFFLVDICLNFRTAFFVLDDRATQRLVSDNKSIALRYVRTWFFFDLAGSIPLDAILYALSSDSSNSLTTTKVAARLPRFLRFAKILRFLKLARAARIGKVIERIQEEVNIKPGVFRVVKFLFVFVIVAHVMACFLFWLGTMDDDFVCYEESKVCTEQNIVPYDLPEGAPVTGVTWITQTKIVSRLVGEVTVAQAPLDTQYLLAMYWAVTTMTTVGYGDVKPANTYEVTTCILTMIIGASTFSYVVGNMASLIAKLDGNSGAFREKMDQATVFMHENNIPKDLKLRIRKYYDYSFNHPLVDLSSSMLRDLSPALHTEVVRYIRRDVLATVSLFQALQNKSKRHLLTALQPKLIPTQHGPGDYIFHAGELGKALYVIAAGEVDLVDSETREVFATFRKGNYFGENALLPDEERRPFTARARTWCDIFAMRVKDLEVVLHDYPAAASAIRLTARLRWARLMKAFEAHNVLVLARERKMQLNGKTLLRVMSRIDEEGEYMPFEPSPARFHEEDESKLSASSGVRSMLSSTLGRHTNHKPSVSARDVDSLTVEEQQRLIKDLQGTVLHNEVGKQLAAGIRMAGRGGWDWSRDWVDGDDIPTESDRLQRHYNGAALADKAVKRTVGQPGKARVRHEEEEDAGPASLDLTPDHIAPGVELERALERIIQRLDVIEAQTDMHEVLIQLKRLNQLSAERQEHQSKVVGGGQARNLMSVSNMMSAEAPSQARGTLWQTQGGTGDAAKQHDAKVEEQGAVQRVQERGLRQSADLDLADQIHKSSSLASLGGVARGGSDPEELGPSVAKSEDALIDFSSGRDWRADRKGTESGGAGGGGT